MRVPLSWLRDFAPISGEVADLAPALDNLGLVVEGVERVGEGLDAIVVGKVVATRPHPDATKVQLVDVDAGDGQVLHVVCGAFNFGPGDLVPLALAGTVMPDGMKIERRRVRGQWSEGMLCSAAELRLSDDHQGILVLPATPGLEPGTPLDVALGIEPDVVFDLEVTPNRPDAMSVAGVARDLAAHLRVPFAIPEPAVSLEPAVQSGRSGVPGEGPDELVTVEALDLCPGFLAQVLHGVTVGTSPPLFARRLVLAGMRPINSLVDVSNYVMLELGHPNHPYDRDRLGGGGLLVRRGRVGERLVTLDGVEREVGPDDCLICDSTGAPVGIGGVMGGADAEISEATTTVLLEVAYFDPVAIARTSKRVGLRTEASARFERGVDPEGIARAAARFVELVTSLGDGAGTSGVAVGGSTFIEPSLPVRERVRVRPERVNAILGTSLSDDDIVGYLEPIGFHCRRSTEGDLDVLIPSWRPDSTQEIDVIEEVARHHGYTRIARTALPVPSVGRLTPYQRDRRRVGEVLAGLGLSEAWTMPLVAPADLERVGLDPNWAVALTNPLASEESVLRTSLLAGLLRALSLNASVRNPDVRLFEVGHVFVRPAHDDVAAHTAVEPSVAAGRSGEAGAGTERPDEHEHLAVALAGCEAPAAVRVWKALVEALRLQSVVLDQSVTVPGLHPARTARVVVDDEGVGVVGEVDPDVVATHGLDGRVAYFEVDLARLLAAPRPPVLYQPISRYPSSDIDLAFEVDEEVPAAAVEATLRQAAGTLLVDLYLFDVFRGGQVGSGRRSLAYRLRFCAFDRTLTDEDVAAVRADCIRAVETTYPAKLRG